MVGHAWHWTGGAAPAALACAILVACAPLPGSLTATSAAQTAGCTAFTSARTGPEKVQMLADEAPSRLEQIREHQTADRAAMPVSIVFPSPPIPSAGSPIVVAPLAHIFKGNGNSLLAGYVAPSATLRVSFYAGLTPIDASPAYLHTPFVLHELAVSPAQPCTMFATPEPAVRTAEYVQAGHPDIFGTVAIHVARTALDKKWATIANSRLSDTDEKWAAMLRRARAESVAGKVGLINAWVNAHLRFADDAHEYGVTDYWASAVQSLHRERGDCEDYAIAKMQLLKAAGIADEDLYLIIANDLVRRADHAVLGVRLAEQMFILDNETDQVLPSAQIRDYRPIITFNASGKWIHGYRAAPLAPPVRLAAFIRPSAPVVPLPSP